MKNKQIHIQYYAILRGERGCNVDTIKTSARTALELYHELKKEHSFSLASNFLKVAINEEFRPWDSTLKNNDHIAFIPPVAGG